MKLLSVLCIAVAQAVVINGRELIRGGKDVTEGYDWVVAIHNERKLHILKLRHYNEINNRDTITRTINSYFLHEDYAYRGAGGDPENDIALIKLNETVPNVNPVSLGSFSNFPKTGLSFRSLGWGYTGMKKAENLQETSLQIVSTEECRSKYHFTKHDRGVIPKSRMFCAQDISSATGLCDGDSGGPLFDNNVQVGVASYGERDYKTDNEHCVKKGIPAVFTFVGGYSKWIKCIKTTNA